MNRTKLRYIYLLYFLFLLLIIPINAQEGSETPFPPTETPFPSSSPEPTFTDSPTNTPLPTETPTELPTATLWPTEMPTETATLTETATTELTGELIASPNTETATASATNTATATSSATYTATATASGINSPYTLIERLEARDYLAWAEGRAWQLLEQNGESWLVTGSNENFPLWQGIGNNIRISSSFILPAGSLSLSLRNSSAGNYRLDLDSAGNISLWRGGALLSSNTLMPLTSLPQELSFTAEAGAIRAELNGILVLAYQDSSPLPAGTVAMSIQAADNFRLKNISLKMSSVEYNSIVASLPTTINALNSSNLAVRSQSSSANILSGDEPAELYRNAVLFTKNGDVYVMQMDNCPSDCPIQLLLDLPGAILHPNWSHDRSQIAFVYNDPQDTYSFSLYHLVQTGSNQVRRISDISAISFRQPVWSPVDSRLLVYEPAGPEDYYDVMLIDLRNCSLPCSTSTNLSNTDDYPEYMARWSDNGNSIIYLTDEQASANGQFDSELVKLDLSSGQRSWLTNDLIEINFFDASADGRYIVYEDVTGSGGRATLYLLNTETGTRRALTSNSEHSTIPSLSPNASAIVFEHRSSTGNLDFEVYYLNLMLESNSPESLNLSSFYSQYDWGYPVPQNSCPAMTLTPTPEAGVQSIRGGGSGANIQSGGGDLPCYSGTATPTLWPTVALPSQTPTATLTPTLIPLPTETPIPLPTETPIPLPTDTPLPSTTPMMANTLTPDIFCVSIFFKGVNIRADYYPTADILTTIGTEEEPKRLRLIGYINVPDIGRYYRVDGVYLTNGDYYNPANIDTNVVGWLSEQVLTDGEGLPRPLCDVSVPYNSADGLLQIIEFSVTPLVSLATGTPTEFPPLPTPTSTPPPDLSGVFPLPMTAESPVRLSQCGLHFGENSVQGLDMVPVGGAGGSFHLVAPASAQIVALDRDGEWNNGLGNFVAIRISMATLHPDIKARLAGTTSDGIDYNIAPYPIFLYGDLDLPYEPYQNIPNVETGAIFIGYAHLDSFSPLLTSLDPDSLDSDPNNNLPRPIDAGTFLGMSGETGRADGRHLHVTVFYSPEDDVLNPEEMGDPMPRSHAEWYFWAYTLGLTHSNYGTPYLVNPLVLWPSAQQGTRCPYWQLQQFIPGQEAPS